jgi:transcriptional regulator with XRE-family HTH domain
MTTRQSPTVRRRQLSAELRKLRAQSNLTQTEVTERLEWSQGKLARMERNEWLRPDLHDIRLLLDIYGVTDEAYRDELLSWAREGRQRGWWHPHKKLLGEQYTGYIGLEAEAATVLTFETLMMPGLLQTPDYARAIIQGWQAEIDAEAVHRRVEVRTRRQEILTREPDPLRLWAVMDEAVLHRRVGNAEIMQAQMHHLLQVAELPRVTLQVIPFEAGAHPGAAGPFSILQFPDLAPEAVYVENLAGELYVERLEQVEEFRRGFRQLTAVALSPEATIKMIADQVKP